MKRTDAGISRYLILAFLVLILLDIFIVTQTKIDSFKDVLPIIVPYVTVTRDISFVIWFLIIFVFFVLGLTNNCGKIPIDDFGFFLLFRIFIGVFQIARVSFEEGMEHVRLGNYFLYLLELIIYFTCVLLYRDGISRLYIKVVKIVVTIISIETIWQSVVGILPQVNYTSTWYKACMNIPVGSSNYLGSIIVPCFVATLFDKQKFGSKKITFIVLVLISVFLTKSRTSMVICLISIFIYLFSGFSCLTKNQRFFRLLIGVLIVGGTSYFVSVHWSEIVTVAYGYSDYVNGGILDKISSGRVSLIESFFEPIINHPLFGNGPNYEETRAHNIIIDLLYQNGFIGFFIFLYAIIVSLKTASEYLRRNTKDFFVHFYKVYILICLIDSIFEISFFTARVNDLLFIPALVFMLCESKKDLYDA